MLQDNIIGKSWISGFVYIREIRKVLLEQPYDRK